ADAPAPADPHAAEARQATAALLGPAAGPEVPLTIRSVAKAWMPFALMSVALGITGLMRQAEIKKPLEIGPLKSSYSIEIPTLHKEVARAKELRKNQDSLEAEDAIFKFTWLSSPGTAVFLS